MNTQTHLLIAAAAFARPNAPAVTTAALLGGLIPDLSLYILVGSGLLQGRSPQQIFDIDYFSDGWQTVFAVDNSAPLFGLLLAAALLAPATRLGQARAVLIAFAGAALLHIAADLPLHHDDGRPHFQPFTDWVFQSPISYWDTNHHAGIVAVGETILALALCVVLWRRFQGVAARAALALAGAAALATGAFWRLFFTLAA